MEKSSLEKSIFFLAFLFLGIIFSFGWHYNSLRQERRSLIFLAEERYRSNRPKQLSISRLSEEVYLPSAQIGDIVKGDLDTPTLLYFITDWCLPCQKELENTIKPLLANRLDLDLLIINLDEIKDQEEIVLLRYFDVIFPGTKIIIRQDGWENWGSEYWTAIDAIRNI